MFPNCNFILVPPILCFLLSAHFYRFQLWCGNSTRIISRNKCFPDAIHATVEADALLPCPLILTPSTSHLEITWRRIHPGKNEPIYSYLYRDDACPVVYFKDTVGARCSYSNRTIRKWFGKKYHQKAEVFHGNALRNGTVSLKLNSVHKKDAGKYECLVRSGLLSKRVIFKLSVTGKKDIRFVLKSHLHYNTL